MGIRRFPVSERPGDGGSPRSHRTPLDAACRTRGVVNLRATCLRLGMLARESEHDEVTAEYMTHDVVGRTAHQERSQRRPNTRVGGNGVQQALAVCFLEGFYYGVLTVT